MHHDKFNLYLGRYLINRYLGTFLDETISMDQLSVDGAIRDINHFIIPIMELFHYPYHGVISLSLSWSYFIILIMELFPF